MTVRLIRGATYTRVYTVIFHNKPGRRTSSRQMLKGPGLKFSGLHISVFQDRPDWGVFCLICSKICSEKVLKSYFSYFWTNLRPSLVELIFEHILCPHERLFLGFLNKKGWKTAEKMFQPAFGCAQHPKAGRNTQHLWIVARGLHRFSSFYFWISF